MQEDIIFVRVFIEGVYFPYPEHISVSEGEGMVTATLSVPNSNKLRAEEWVAKKVHIFWANKRVIELFGSDPGVKRLSNWPILFGGEIAGASENATVSNKSVSFRLTSSARHLQQTQLYFYDPDRDKELDAYQRAAFLGNREIKFETSGVLSKTTRVTEALKIGLELAGEDQDRFVAYHATIRTLLDEAANSNASYRRFAEQLALDRRFGAHGDPDVKSILTLEQWASLIDKRVAALDNSTPLQSLLEICSGAMRYNWVNVAQPIISRSQEPTNKSGIDDTEEAVFGLTYKKIRQELDVLRARLRSASGVLLSDGATRTYSLRTSIGSFQVGTAYFVAESGGELQYLNESQFIEQVRARLTDGDNRFAAVKNVLDAGYWPGLPYVPAGATGERDVTKAREAEAADESGTLSAGEAELRADLLQQKLVARQETLLHEWLVTPNMTMSQPPRCNVITPSLLESYSMQINFFSMPTRLYATAYFTKEGKEWYLAPSTAVFYRVNTDNRVDIIGDAFDRLAPQDQTTFSIEDLSDEED